MPRIVILGGGVIGLSLAYELARRGLAATLVEPGELARQSSWAGAGIVTPADLAGAKAPIDRLRALSVERMHRWSHELREETGIDNGFRLCGAFEVAMDEAEVPALFAAARAWREQGVPVEDLEPSDLARLEPETPLAAVAAYRLPTEAQVRNPWHTRALATACARRGVEIRERCGTVRFCLEGGRITAARTADGEVPGELFVVAAGAWSGGLLATLGIDLATPPVRGQIALLRAPRAPLSHVVWAGPRYLVPRPDGRVLVGSTTEHVGFAPHPTAAGVRDLLAFACRLAPSLAGLEVEKLWAGLRPGSVDGLPYLGALPGHPNLFAATGHYRAGFELAAGTAVVLAELLLGEPLSLELEAFAPARGLVSANTPGS